MVRISPLKTYRVTIENITMLRSPRRARFVRAFVAESREQAYAMADKSLGLSACEYHVLKIEESK